MKRSISHLLLFLYLPLAAQPTVPNQGADTPKGALNQSHLSRRRRVKTILLIEINGAAR